MNYVSFEVNGNEYKLKMSVDAMEQLERVIGCNPVLVFGTNGNIIPTVSRMTLILWASLQKYHHGFTKEASTDLFEKWLDEGHIVNDFISIIVEIYRCSGLIAKEEEKPKN